MANGVTAVGEGANMPSTLEAIAYFQQQGILFAPAKAANAGGVAVSALEMAQNSERLQWTFEEVAEKYATPDDLVAGANITAFEKVAEVMMAQGLVGSVVVKPYERPLRFGRNGLFLCAENL